MSITIGPLRLERLSETRRADASTPAGASFEANLERRLADNEGSGRASIGRNEAAVAGNASGPVDGRTDNVVVNGHAGRWLQIVGIGNVFAPYAGIDEFNQWYGRTQGGLVSDGSPPPTLCEPTGPSMSANEVRDADGVAGGCFVGDRYLGIDRG